ncbi:MAG TPA: 2-hydroxyglutaryl-CoA dehydratase, partial [Actinobacteria bacterium]|nr:2-hydroxyglutaryl-CoA dehydratase [Actinomycetota bacterium]
MIITAGLDIGSTYTKALLQNEDGEILAKAMLPTGFRLQEIARTIYDRVLEEAGLGENDISYVIATGPGRHQVDF